MNTLIEYTKWLVKWIFIIFFVVIVGYVSYHKYTKYQEKLIDKFALQCITKENTFLSDKELIDKKISYIVFQGFRGSSKPEYATYYYNSFNNKVSLKNKYSVSNQKTDQNKYYFSTDLIESVYYKFEINRENLDVLIKTQKEAPWLSVNDDDYYISTKTCKKIPIEEFNNAKSSFYQKMSI